MPVYGNISKAMRRYLTAMEQNGNPYDHTKQIREAAKLQGFVDDKYKITMIGSALLSNLKMNDLINSE